MKELAKQLVDKLDLSLIINSIDSGIKQVAFNKKDELYSCIIEEIKNQLNKKVK